MVDHGRECVSRARESSSFMCDRVTEMERELKKKDYDHRLEVTHLKFWLSGVSISLAILLIITKLYL